MSLVLPDRYERIASMITVTSPLIHSDERVEVMQRFRREPFHLGGELRDIPVYSGNAIRGMLRRAAALRLCDLLGVQDRELPLPVFYLLFSGGYLEGGDHSHRTEELERFRMLLPIIALLGGSWESRILHGLLDVDRGVPVCAELAGTPGHDYSADGMPSVYDLLTEQSYTRKDDRPPQAEGNDHVQQMRYTFEALIPGTRLLHGFTLRTHDPVMRGCLADAILTCTEWQALGGRSAIGHGRFTWTAAAWAHETEAHVAAYREHVTDQQTDIRRLLGLVDQQKIAA